MQETSPVPEDERSTENQRVDEPERADETPHTEDTETVAEGGQSATSEDGTTDRELIDRRFTRHRAGDTVVLYDRLEQTTWVQADIDPSELV